MPRVEGGGVFVDGPNVVAFESEPGVRELFWNGWLPMYRLDGRSPDERARVHGINVANRKLSLAAFGAFIERWKAALLRCRTEDEVIALGRPSYLREFPEEPGAAFGERKDLSEVNGRFNRLVALAYGEATRVRARVAGRRAPLDVKVDAKVSLRIDYGGVSCSAGASSVGVGVGCRGTTSAGVQLGADGRTSELVGVGPVSVERSGDRIESVTYSSGPAYGRLGTTSLAVGIGAKRALGTGTAGPKVSAEARLGVDVELLDAETVRRALSNEDLWAKKR